MEAIATSFSARRPAAGSLPAFSLPPPNAEIPRTTDGLSPSLSSVHTGGSQASQHHSNMNSYTYSGSWPNHGQYQPADQQQPQQSHQQPQQHHQQQPLPHSPYSRQSVYGHANPMSFPRSSQSPATNISASPFDQTQQHYTHDAMTGAPQHSGLVAPVSQSSMHASLPAHADAYAHTRPGSNPSYYTTSGPSQFPSYPPHSPNQPSPTTGSPGARGVNSVANGPSGPYRYGHFPLPNMGTNHGTIMSNMHHPGGQMSMIPGMGHHHAYGAGPVASYSQAAQPQSERPFKCDQCIQSFSRNHDLKRHKRIHLAVKPFPCNYCSKSFSRKDALKRHRLVKGCEAKLANGELPNENANHPAEHERN